MQERGIIRPSRSPWSSPLVLVTKSNGTLRPCGDYRKLNQVTTSDMYPLPRIDDILYKIGGSSIFTKLDLEKAYNQIPLNPADIPKTAVITPFGLFEWCFMPFGLKCASQTFQRHIDSVLKPVSHCAQGYVDDIVIFSDNEETHKRDVTEVLKHLRAAGLRLNENKFLSSDLMCRNTASNL